MHIPIIQQSGPVEAGLHGGAEERARLARDTNTVCQGHRIRATPHPATPRDTTVH